MSGHNDAIMFSCDRANEFESGCEDDAVQLRQGQEKCSSGLGNRITPPTTKASNISEWSPDSKRQYELVQWAINTSTFPQLLTDLLKTVQITKQMSLAVSAS